MSDDDCIIIAGGDTTAELLSVFGFKVLFRRNKDICAWIELQILCRPLFRQMIGNHEKALLTETKAFAFLCCRHHLKGFSRANNMRQQCVAAVEDMSYGVYLVLSQSDLGVDAHKTHVTAIVFSGTDAVELLVVELCQSLAASRVFPNPFSKSLFDHLLLALRDCRFLLVEHRSLFAVLILDIIEDADILQIERLFNDLIGIDAACPVGAKSFDITTVVGLALHIPLSGIAGVVNMDIPL